MQKNGELQSPTEIWQAAVEQFNQKQFVECVLLLEQLWFAGRSDFYKGLIRVCVALNQLRLGLLTSPRFLLTTASELLEPFEPEQHGLDVAALRRYLDVCLSLIPDDQQTGEGHVPWATVPRFKLPGTSVA